MMHWAPLSSSSSPSVCIQITSMHVTNFASSPEFFVLSHLAENPGIWPKTLQSYWFSGYCGCLLLLVITIIVIIVVILLLCAQLFFLNNCGSYILFPLNKYWLYHLLRPWDVYDLYIRMVEGSSKFVRRLRTKSGKNILMNPGFVLKTFLCMV